MPIIQQNLDLILAGGAIVALLVLYIVIKKVQNKKHKVVDKYHDIEVVEDIYDDAPHEEAAVAEESAPPAENETKEEERQEEEEVVAKKQEREEEKAQTTIPKDSSASNINPRSKIATIKVPPHGKITKENFKDFSGIKLLVAEDNIINQKVIAGLLAESGIDITFAGDGLEAISTLNNQKDFDIVLMDAHMPNMDGFEATRKIRENPNFDQVAVIALSGDTASDDIHKMYDAGMDAHLGKPIQIDALYDILYAFSKKNSQESEQQTLNISSGIEVAGGDENFYKEILREFLEDYETAGSRIQLLLETDKTQEANALLLDLIGITANIGAEEANSAAITLKQALKSSEDEKKEAYLAFADSFRRLLKKIRSYLHS